MVNIADKAMCCGCNACGDVCAHDAITFKTDIEGFWYPEVDKSKCTDCRLCEKVCPIINIDTLKKNDLKQSICYVAEHKDIEVVFDSTSGGLFSALADIMYRNKGYVGGAIFNEDFSVRQYISPDKKDLIKLRSSKYLQSNFTGFYKQLRDLLKKEENVLVCGSPCQMAALRSFLRKDYENLIIVDFVCRGTNSPKVWRKYLDTFEERYGSPVVYCKAKSKEYGWRNLTQKVVLANGKAYYEPKDSNNYTKGYLQTGVFCRPSCYECKFKGYPRIADITLADFWGVENVKKTMDKNLGLSLVMVNSQKGASFFEKAKIRINAFQVPFETIEKGNLALTKSLDKPKVNRERFFKDLDNMTFTQIADKYILSTPMSKKFIIKKYIKYLFAVWRGTNHSPKAIYQFFKYNTFNEIIHGNVLIPASHVVIQLEKGGKIIKKGISYIGTKRYRKSKLETRLLIEKGGVLELGPNTNIMYGADIEVFHDARLIYKGEGGSNIGATVICGEKIEIGKGTMMGRNVLIRDNNGDHYINRTGYKNTRPVVIGEKAWLCEGCTIMLGVNIGDGVIVGAKAFVTSNIPPNTMVSGNPSKVVDEDVLWKY